VNLSTPERADALAAQYVLGTLSSRARARFGRLVGVDRAVTDAVEAWEARLLPFAETIAPVPPPARVWQRVLERVQGGRAAPAAAASLWANLDLWRGLALAGFATAMALAVVLLSTQDERPEQSMIAVLAGADARPVLIATADRAGHSLRVKALAPVAVAAGRALELWALPAGGNPRSLGLIAPSGSVRIALTGPAETALALVPALAVSLEPSGGSPTGLPTGPVLYSGPIQRLY
jgi:anti-sigma-K factor RskA